MQHPTTPDSKRQTLDNPDPATQHLTSACFWCDDEMAEVGRRLVCKGCAWSITAEAYRC